MSDAANKAVFLSYASQDAEAARRIADALRASGVEVWFDQNELVGGDAWDHKIRTQIKDCALFIPMVSANTQSRREGYFRLEWKLADDRTHLMARGTPFLLPVCVDDTRDWDAIVPDSFTSVQWTRLPGGAGTEKFTARVKALLSGGSNPHASTSHVPFVETSPEPGVPKKLIPRWLAPAVIGGVAFTAVALWLVLKSAPPAKSIIPAAASPAPALSPAHQLADKARALFENQGATSDDYTLAEDYCKQALKLDSNDAYAWAVYAELSSEMIGNRMDASAERRELARTQAERAVKLAPDSGEARYAKASYLRRTPGPTVGEAEKILRGLLAQPPADPRVFIALAKIVGENTEDREHISEALALLERAAAFPARRAWALDVRAYQLMLRGLNTEAEAAIDESLAIQITRNALVKKVSLANLRGDLAMAQANLAKLPAEDLRGDQGAYVAAQTWLWSRNPTKCLEVLAPINRDYLSSTYFRGPTDLVRGQAYHMAGKSEAARIAWQAALQVVDKRMAEQRSDPDLIYIRAYLLGLLDRPVEAAAALQLWEELNLSGNSRGDRLWLLVNLKTPDRALDRLEQILQEGAQSFFRSINLQLDPGLDPLRDHPRFKALLAREEAKQRSRAAAGSSDLLATHYSLPATLPDQKSVAVLPFTNLSPDPENAFFCDGVHEDVITALAKIHDLKVISRTSVMRYKSGDRNLRQIGAELDVAHVLEGSVRRANNKVRVTAQLIDARTDVHLWAETYTVDLTDVFTVQSELAAAITSALKATLSPAEKSLIARRPTQNQIAYDLYLQGRAAQQTYGEQIEKMEQAVALDPEFADALASISALSAYAFWEETDPARAATHRARALSALAAAERLAPTLPKVREARANIHYRINHDFARAWEELRGAEASSPNDSDIKQSLGYTARRLGRWQDALRYFEQSRRLDPFNQDNRFSFHIETLVLVRRMDEARRLGAEWMAAQPEDSDTASKRRKMELDWLDAGTTVPEPDAAEIKRLGETLFRDDAWRVHLWLALRRQDWAAADSLLASHPTEVLPEREFQRPAALVRAELAFITGNTALAAQQAGLAIAFYRDRAWPPRYEALAQLGIAQAEAWSGRTDDAVRDATAVLTRMRQEDAFLTALYVPDFGRILIAAGRREEAIALLRQMMSGPSGMTPGQVRRDPLWSRLKDDPRFEETLKGAKPL